MPLDDTLMSREPDGTFNEDYCKWCYTDGSFTYESKEALIDFMIGHMPDPSNTPESDRRAQYDSWLSQLKHWQ